MNSSRGYTLIVLGVFGFAASGCLTEAGGDEAAPMDFGADNALENPTALLPNALTPNALTPNALTPNALTPNALTPNALTPNSLSPNAMAAIQAPEDDGAVSRKVLEYTVGCALDPTQSFSFAWIDAQGNAQSETYWGALGLATSWADKPLNKKDEEWVSACLASRINRYGVPVMISVRGKHPGLHKPDPSELTTYAMEEGAFWGNLFSSTPRLFACYYGPNADYARSQLRDCAAGHVEPNGGISECGIVEIVGACEDVCQSLHNSGKYRPKCQAPGATSSNNVITTFLM
ncbi:MAG: hypothetical protein HUU21_14030 [Polyangiaceae bacterium]|nr:hypothetical protein [Polyangiaceae bacterium]NUQ74669.1 hypothetical protein [Polyangiaceae bacterium]